MEKLFIYLFIYLLLILAEVLFILNYSPGFLVQLQIGSLCKASFSVAVRVVIKIKLVA